MRWAIVRPDGITTLICWNGHRFDTAGALLADAAVAD